MSKTSQPWYRESRGLWYATIQGKQVNLGANKAQAFEAYARLISPQPKIKHTVSQPLPVIIDAFLDWLKPRRSSETFTWYQYRLERIARRYPKLPAANLTIAMVEDWVSEYQLAQTSRRNYFRAIKYCMKWARSRGLIKKNRIRHLEVPAGDSREVVISQEEYHQILTLAKEESFRDLVITTWETGCRPQESLRVEARHVDLTHQRWIFPKSESKNKKLSRVVYLTDKAVEITQKLVKLWPDGKLFRNSKGVPWRTDAVNNYFHRLELIVGKQLLEQHGKTITEKEIGLLIPKLNSKCKRKGKIVQKSQAELRSEARRKLTRKKAIQLAPKWSLYAIRHTWATNALQRGVDPLTTAILMGHSDPSMLSKVYQHVALNPAHMLNQAKKAVE